MVAEGLMQHWQWRPIAYVHSGIPGVPRRAASQNNSHGITASSVVTVSEIKTRGGYFTVLTAEYTAHVAYQAHRALRPINVFFAVPEPARPFTNFSFFFSPDLRFCFNSSFVSASLVSEGDALLISESVVWLVRPVRGIALIEG
jgi:hypothetical protein